MSDAYERWKHDRARAEVPPSFTDRTMSAVRALGAPRRPLVLVLLSSRAVRMGLWVLGALALAVRVLAVLALFEGR